MINVPEIIGSVIDSMRKEGDYTSFSNVGSTYTLQSVNTLTEDEWINLNDTDEFQAVNVSSTSFDIVSGSDPLSSGSWTSLEPFYMYGHRLEIANRLLMKDKDKVYKYQKYPLFALRLPINEAVSFDNVHDVSINIAVLEFTNKNYRAEQRYENVITPILMPLYLDFVDKLKDNGNIQLLGTPEHDKVDRLFYGIDELEGNVAYIFNDPLDGIELLNLNLKLINTCTQ
jgi:hypothetical protein